MATRPLRVAVFGTGFGCFTHVRALRNAGFDVCAVVGRDPAKTARRAELFEVPLALTSASEALALDGLDAVTIATPPHTHAEIALAAIARTTIDAAAPACSRARVRSREVTG